MYRVILVDDERLIIRGLSSVVPWQKLGCEVVGTAYDGSTGLRLIRELQPDIVLTDIRMPNMDGLTMLAALHSEFPRMQTSVLTAYRDFDYAREAIHLWVCRYLLKPSDMNELTEAIRQMTARLDALPPRPGGEAGHRQQRRGQLRGADGAGIHEGPRRGAPPFPQRCGGARLCEPVAPVQAPQPGDGPELF